MDANLEQALYISLIGVMFVFVFLTFLIAITHLMVKIIVFFQQKDNKTAEIVKPAVLVLNSVKTTHNLKIAAITAAIHIHRKKNQS